MHFNYSFSAFGENIDPGELAGLMSNDFMGNKFPELDMERKFVVGSLSDFERTTPDNLHSLSIAPSIFRQSHACAARSV